MTKKKVIEQETNKWENPAASNQLNGGKRRRREWDEQVTRMDAERLVKISRDHLPAGIKSGRPKRGWSDLIFGQNRRNRI